MKKVSKELVEAIGICHAMNKWLNENKLAENWYDVFYDWTEEMDRIHALFKQEGIFRMPHDEFNRFEEINNDVNAFEAYCREYGYAA